MTQRWWRGKALLLLLNFAYLKIHNTDFLLKYLNKQIELTLSKLCNTSSKPLPQDSGLLSTIILNISFAGLLRHLQIKHFYLCLFSP